MTQTMGTIKAISFLCFKLIVFVMYKTGVAIAIALLAIMVSSIVGLSKICGSI